ncbi:MAG: hypothetical protein FGM54_11045, partial [Chitinophagaceae bacterium]|nr:hypothetical protein [Chitinophagaceae bacterium]
TSATLHGDFVQKNPRELVDGGNEGIIAHEMFHQWFGDLITCESWSHLVMNEGFAAFGEQIWYEHQYGSEAGLKQAYQSMEKYLNYASKNADGPIVDFNYKDKEDMFSAITYQKGARVLNLLRHELGNETFFLALKTFLLEHAFQAVQIDDLRRTCEKVSGRDLRNFFNQWFYRGGHPKLDIRYMPADSNGIMQIVVQQKQEESIGLYQFPLAFKIRQGNLSKNYSFTISKKQEVFFVKKLSDDHPESISVSVDPNGLFIGEIVEQKPVLPLIEIAKKGNYIERIRAYKALKDQWRMDTVRLTLIQGLQDSDETIRGLLIDALPWKDSLMANALVNQLPPMILRDPSSAVRAKAIQASAASSDVRFEALYKKACRDSSYTVAGRALQALYKRQPDQAYQMAHMLETDARGVLLEAISDIYGKSGSVRDLPFFHENLMRCFKGRRAVLLEDFTQLGRRVNNAEQESVMKTTLIQRANDDESPQVREMAIKQLYAIRTDLYTRAAQN